jgi:hypothetical protein
VSLIPVKILSVASLAAVVGFTTYVPPVQAFNFGDMMNPGRWMGGGKNRDRYDDDYYGDYGPYGGGPGGGGPYGGGPYGGYGGGPYGGGPYGAPYGGGYGMPGYGAPGYMGAPMAAPAPAAPAAPAQSGSSSQSEINALKRRIEELEAGKQQSQPAPSADWPSAPAFRPMNQY